MRHRIIDENHLKDLRNRIFALFRAGEDTVGMSKVLQIPEHECERQLNAALEARRIVASSFR